MTANLSVEKQKREESEDRVLELTSQLQGYEERLRKSSNDNDNLVAQLTQKARSINM